MLQTAGDGEEAGDGAWLGGTRLGGAWVGSVIPALSPAGHRSGHGDLSARRGGLAKRTRIRRIPPNPAAGRTAPAASARSAVISSRMSHPCLTCGACCAAYRVSMHWSEAEPSLGGQVPVELTETLGAHQRCMRGTWAERPHCIALDGTVGEHVHCRIYDVRPSPCRELRMAWEDGTPSPQCDRARALYGLPPLTPEDVARALAR